MSSNTSDPLEVLQRVAKQWVSQEDAQDQFGLLKRDFKFVDITLNSHNFKNVPHVLKEAQAFFQDAANDLIHIQIRQSYYPINIHVLFFNLNHQILKAKEVISRTAYSFPDVSFQLLPNKDSIAIPNFVMEFIDTVVENISGLLKFNDPSSPFCIGIPMMGQIEEALEELKFLKSFVCFVSDRCIESKSQHTFFNHILQVTSLIAMLSWLYALSQEDDHWLLDGISSLLSERLIDRKPKKPSTSEIYLGVLHDLKLAQSQWYPVIQIMYMVDCKVGFVENLLHNLEGFPNFRNKIAVKANLEEMLNFLRADFTKLHGLEFHLQEINSMIVDTGILVYSLNDVNIVPDFRVEIQHMQEKIYLITRKTFLLQSNLPETDRVGSADFILENREMLLSLYSNSVDSVKRNLQTIQEELKFFQAVVEQQHGLQHFATKTNGLMYEVEYVFDACKRKAVPDWCLLLWILNIGEDIRVLMAEVTEVQEKNVFDLVLHNVKSAISAHNSSQFDRNPGMNEEMVGLKDVMVELRRQLTEGSSKLDVISIVGMPGVGKTTLANKLYFDQSVIFHFDIRAQVCVSQEYTRKDMLLTILGDLIGKNAELDKKAESVLAHELRQKLFHNRYLIFIDDIWHTDAWDDLCLSFQDDNNGSRIILTTRNRDVASYAKHFSDPHHLRLLSNDESWMLLQNKVFNEEICPLALQDIGKRIALKCGGLPLSIVLVAGILTTMEKEEHCWEQVITNLGPHIQAQSEDTIDLSYQNLPDHLRPCFLYFGLFPEDKEIQVSKLTWLWISEGFVTTHTEKPLEDIAKDYLENLVGRNLVMVAKKSCDGKIKACHIHDLLFDFCRKKAELENFLERIKGDREVDPSHFFPPKYKTPRRLSLHSRCDNLKKWCLSSSHVKSFQFREARNIAFSSISHASDIFKRFKFLRVLDFEFTIIDSFPEELTLLRYAAFRISEDTLSLPANLWNLETLIVQGIRVLLPDTIWKMAKLRHLHIYNQASFTLNSGQEISESPSIMDDLQTISSAYFSCVKNADKILEKTPNLRKLRCEVSKFDGSFPAFSNLTKLEMLKISSSTRLTLINQLKFPSKLKKLTLSNFYIHLTEVSTLPELEVLKLLGVTISSNTWKVNDEQFGKLKFLKLENPSFSEWDISDDAFPCLEHLVMKRCRYLKVIPSRFEDSSSLKSVEIISSNEALVKSVKAIRETLIDMTGTSGFEIIIRKY